MQRHKYEIELGLFRGQNMAVVLNYFHFLSEPSLSPPCLCMADCSLCLEGLSGALSASPIVL